MSLQDKIAGRLVVASVSGGKDSAAMSLWLTEQGIEHERVFCATGWEHPVTYAYVLEPEDAREEILALGQWSEQETDEFLDRWMRKHGPAPLQRALGPITKLEPARRMVQLIEHKAMFPQRTRRFCTTELKVKPIAAFLDRRIEQGEDVLNAVGIRAGESRARANMPEWEWWGAVDCEIWRPIIGWTEADVIAMHTRHGLHPNPLYLRGASRVGCWPCIFARKAEIRQIAEQDPGRIDLIGMLESSVTARAAMRAMAKGVEPGHPPAFFQAPTRDENGQRKCMPIEQVVAWSRTAQGGRQMELFAPDRDEGCVRWGLCETGEES